MKNRPGLRSLYLPLAVVAGLAASTVSGFSGLATVGASATIYGVVAAGGYDYTITLENTGADNLRSFWYGWTESGNNLPSNPSSAGNSLGWVNTLDGNSIMWGNGAGTALTTGQSATFTFFSTSTPTAITTLPSGLSVAYVNGIDASQGVINDSTGSFAPVLVAPPAPEPSSLALMAFGAVGLVALGKRKLRAQQ